MAFVHGLQVHNAGFTGAGALVAVIDTGIDTDHPDLIDDLVGEACFVASGGCPGGGAVQTGPGAAEAAPGQGHGTHVAGIITSDGIVASPGLAPDASIVAINVFGPYGWAYGSDIIAAIDYVVTDYPETDAINMSLGAGAYAAPCDSLFPSYAAAIDAATAAGITVVAASGNSGAKAGIAAPACVGNAVSVGAVYDGDGASGSWGICSDQTPAAGQPACFSQSATGLDLLAPGVAVVSDAPGGATMTLSGTSMATPHVAAALALLRAADPSLTPGQAVARLAAAGVPTIDPANGVSTPRLDLASAFGMTPDTVAPEVTVAAPALVDGRSVPVVVEATDDTGVAGYYWSEAPQTPSPLGQGWAAGPPDQVLLAAGGDGERTVYVWAADAAGNVSHPASATVTLDTTAPQLDILVQAAASSRDVRIAVTAIDENGPTGYYLSETPTAPSPAAAGWSTAPETEFRLSSGDGVKRVYGWAIDAAGNVSARSRAVVVLDTISPRSDLRAPRNQIASKRQVLLAGTARDVGRGSGVAAVSVAVERQLATGCEHWTGRGWVSGCDGKYWVEASGAARWRLRLLGLRPGVYTVFHAARDRAGNLEPSTAHDSLPAVFTVLGRRPR